MDCGFLLLGAGAPGPKTVLYLLFSLFSSLSGILYGDALKFVIFTLKGSMAGFPLGLFSPPVCVSLVVWN